MSRRRVEQRCAAGWRRPRALCSAAAAVLLLASSPAVRAQDAEIFFDQYCTACHSIGGGPFIGPDLKDVTARHDRAWLVRFILDPDDVIESGDPYAARLVEEAGGLVMPDVPELTPRIAVALLDFIEARSRAESGESAGGVPASDEPFTPEDIERGRRFFFGEARLSAGGAACFSCHAVPGAGGLGGGALGPDLSQVYERLQGRRALGGWLSAPPTPTMRASYGLRGLTQEEVQALVAFFEDQAMTGGAETGRRSAQFLLFGASGAAMALFVFGGVWRGRFRGVRRPLVGEARPGGERWR
ncbi:MAG: c-type cytochrome [Acidobacteria bacterium]|nr:c-type cytochrome [Acidobacteriota bacterium]